MSIVVDWRKFQLKGASPKKEDWHDGGGTFQIKLRLYMKDGFAVAIMANGAGFDRNELTDAAANVVLSMLGG